MVLETSDISFRTIAARNQEIVTEYRRRFA